MALSVTIPGPVHRDDCGHSPADYVGSFRAYFDGQFKECDLYVFDTKKGQEVCIRTGEAGEYHSPGDIVSAIKNSQWEPYTTALALLREKGFFRWKLSGVCDNEN